MKFSGKDLDYTNNADHSVMYTEKIGHQNENFILITVDPH